MMLFILKENFLKIIFFKNASPNKIKKVEIPHNAVIKIPNESYDTNDSLVFLSVKSHIADSIAHVANKSKIKKAKRNEKTMSFF